MINGMNKRINKLNKKLGVEIRISTFSSQKLSRSAKVNLVVGSVLTTAGVMLERKELFFLGSLGLLGSLILSVEASNLKKRSK